MAEEAAVRARMTVEDPPLAQATATEVPPQPTAQEDTTSEVIAAAPPALPEPKYARAIYNFTPESADEVELHEGDPVLVVDDVSSEEWWCIRVVEADGVEKEGVVPATYLSILTEQETQELLGGAAEEEGTMEGQPKAETPSAASAAVGAVAGAVAGGVASSVVADTDNVPLAQSVPKTSTPSQPAPSTPKSHAGPALPKVQPTVASPVSASSASVASVASSSTSGSSRPKPNPSKTRLWQDKSGTYQVDAEFLRYEEDQGKVHLHKVNGVKIAVPLSKLSATDVAHVEKLTGLDLGSGMGKEATVKDAPPSSSPLPPSSTATKAVVPSRSERPAEVAPPPPRVRERVYNPRFDWFDFFNIECGIGADDALRYAKTFRAERMDDGVLPHASRDMLRGMGLSNGDIGRAMIIVDEYRRGLRQVSDIGAADAEYAQRLQDEEDARSSSSSSSAIGRGHRRPQEVELQAHRGETDEEMARRLQAEEDRNSPASRGSSSAGYRPGSIRQSPAKSAPTRVDAATLVRAGETLSGAGKSGGSDGSSVSKVAFEDDAWEGEPSSKALVVKSTTESASPTNRKVLSEVEKDLSQLESWANTPTPSTRRGARPQASAPPPPTAYGGYGAMMGSDPKAEGAKKVIDLESSLPPPLVPGPQPGWGSGVFVPTRSSGRPAPPPPPTTAYPALRALTNGPSSSSSSPLTPPSIAAPPPPSSSSMSLVRRAPPVPPSGFAGPAPKDQGLEALRLQQQLARIKQEQMMRQRAEQERMQREAAQAEEQRQRMMAQQQATQVQQAQMLQAQRMMSMGPSPFGSGSVQVGGYGMVGGGGTGGYAPSPSGGGSMMGGGGGGYGYGRPGMSAGSMNIPPPRPTVAPSTSVMGPGPTSGVGGGGTGVNPLRPFDHIFNKPVQPPPVPMRGPMMMTGPYPSGPYGGASGMGK